MTTFDQQLRDDQAQGDNVSRPCGARTSSKARRRYSRILVMGRNLAVMQCVT
jgi:hypothetical protein